MVQVFLTAAAGEAYQYWEDPGDWNPADNKVECIGGGGMGGSGASEGSGGTGGGGGAYAVGTNLDLVFPVLFCVGPGSGGGGTATKFNFTVHGFGPSTEPGCVSAQNGYAGSMYGSGYEGMAFFPAGFPGGRSGYGGADNYTGGSGGGAGGPSGPGTAGGNDVATTYGGAADGGVTPGSAIHSPGVNGTQFDATHGCGSGGSRAQPGVRGYTGGLYGGGGGGFSISTQPVGGSSVGGPGLIVITYTPLPPGARREQVAVLA